jgi:hypothetical protein
MNNEKILCLGDDSSADAWGQKLTTKYALEHQITFHGVLTDVNQALEPGCYHTGPHSLQIADIIKISKKFDRIVLLDQTQEQYSHSDIFVSMFRLLNFLEKNIPSIFSSPMSITLNNAASPIVLFSIE